MDTQNERAYQKQLGVNAGFNKKALKLAKTAPGKNGTRGKREHGEGGNEMKTEWRRARAWYRSVCMCVCAVLMMML